jgi:hypothetical protein
MDDIGDDDLRQRIETVIESASVEYQRCQLAALVADLEGQPLAGAVLRSISESQVGQVQALARLLYRAGGAVEQGATRRALAAALERFDRHAALECAVAERSEAAPEPLRGDVAAALRITATNRPRLEGLVAALSVPAGAE